MDFKTILNNNFNFTEAEIEYTLQMFKPEVIKAKAYFLKEGKIEWRECAKRLALVRFSTTRAVVRFTPESDGKERKGEDRISS